MVGQMLTPADRHAQFLVAVLPAYVMRGNPREAAQLAKEYADAALAAWQARWPEAAVEDLLSMQKTSTPLAVGDRVLWHASSAHGVVAQVREDGRVVVHWGRGNYVVSVGTHAPDELTRVAAPDAG